MLALILGNWKKKLEQSLKRNNWLNNINNLVIQIEL